MTARTPRARLRATMTPLRLRLDRTRTMPTVRPSPWKIRPRSWRLGALNWKTRGIVKGQAPSIHRRRISGSRPRLFARKRIRLMRQLFLRSRQSMTLRSPRLRILCPRQRTPLNPRPSLRPRLRMPTPPLRKKTPLLQLTIRSPRQPAAMISSRCRWIWIRQRRSCPRWKRSSRPKGR